MRAIGLALSVALTGCYSPSIAPCELACASGSLCPDGLTCNTQNICALPGDMCGGMPIDAPLIDAPEIDAPMNAVTVEVRDLNNDPFPAAVVLFADSTGVLVADVLTGADGRASVPMLPGGSATVVRSLLLPGGNKLLAATTYVDLWPGAHIINQVEYDSTTSNVEVKFNARPGAAIYGVYASCGAPIVGPSLSAMIRIPDRCSMFDVLVTASPTTSGPITEAAFLPAQTSSTIIVNNTQWMPARSVNGQFMNVPPAANTRGFTPGVWITPTLPRLSTSSELTIGTFNQVANVAVPTGVGITGQLQLTVPAGNQTARQSVYDRFPPTAANLNRDYAGTVLPWVNDPVFTPGTRRLLWSHIVPAGFTPAPASFFVATVQYNKDASTMVAWRMFGPASRITPGGNQFYVDFPDVPGDRMFEPTSATLVTSDTIALWQVEPAAVRPMIERYDPNVPDLNFFKIPGLQHITLSSSAPPTTP